MTAELDFDDWGAPAPAVTELMADSCEYDSWECDCAKPTRHYRQALRGGRSRHSTDWEVRILPGRGAVHQARGEGVGTELGGEAIECPTWRPARLVWYRVEPVDRAPVATAECPVELRAGRIGEPRPLAVADLPPRCTAKAILCGPGVTSAILVTGRQLDWAPVVTRYRIRGADWSAFWTEGKFDEANVAGRRANLATLRAHLKGESE